MELQLSANLQEQVLNFFKDHPPRRIGRNLRRVLFDYLHTELKAGIPIFIDELLWDLYDLFELLDKAEDETMHWHNKNPNETEENKREEKKMDASGKKEQHSPDSESVWPLLRAFFTNWQPQDVEEDLWVTVKLALTNENADNPIERSNIIYIYEELKQLVEALYKLHEQNKNTPSTAI